MSTVSITESSSIDVQRLADSIDNLTKSMEIFYSPDLMDMSVQYSFMVWVSGLSLGWIIKYLSKLKA